MRGSLVVPTLNESASIRHVLDSFRAATLAANETLFPRDPIDWEMIVVDGASTDGTADIARGAGARVVTERRKGYGRAYLTGFAEASGEVIATLDGDATYPVDDIPKLVRTLLDEPLDFITCNRLAYLDRKAMTTEHRIGNWVLNRFLQVGYSAYLKGAPGGTILDSQSGMWVFRRSILDKLALTQEGMPFSEEFKIEVLAHGLRMREVPIRYAERWGAPKLSSWRDGRKNLFFLIQKRLDMAKEKQVRQTLRLGRHSEPSPR